LIWLQKGRGTAGAGGRAALAARFATNLDGVIENLAQEYGLSPLEATRLLPPHACRWAAPERFGEIMEDLTGWGAVLFLVHTPSAIVEVKAPVPPGTFARGYYNLHGDSPLGGHLKAERCVAIGFVRRPFMGRESASIQFFDCDGASMFKVFVSRGADRTLDAGQLERFEALASRVTEAAPAPAAQ